MKIVGRNCVPDRTGKIKLELEDSDDLWYAYNLIAHGDSVTADTIRKVHRDSESGKKDSKLVNLNLEVQVEGVEYEKDGSVLRVRGKNISENEFVKIGAYHTLELEVKREFVLRKEVWDSLALTTLKEASDFASSADLAVVIMQEGLGSVFLIGRSVTSCRARIESSVPRKHGHSSAFGYDSSLKKFFDKVMNAFVEHIDFSVVRCVVIASPGFTNDQFRSHLLLEAERRQLRPIIENKSRILVAHANSGYKHSVGDVLSAPNVMKIIKDTMVAKEVRALNDFFKMLSNNPYRACYGPKHVEVAHEGMAIQTLLITDELIRNSEAKARTKYEDLMKSVNETGGEVVVFSSMHVSGEQLAQLTGIAAILRFPLPELDDIEM